MELIDLVLMLSLLLCSLVAGLLLGFALVVMPGIRVLNDHDFLRSFQVMDRVIQNNQPIFVFVWIGSALSLIATCILGYWMLEGVEMALVIGAGIAYILGVQFPTVTINIPLNNGLQSLDLKSASESELAEARKVFESKWNRWNVARTCVAILTSMLLINVVLMR